MKKLEKEPYKIILSICIGFLIIFLIGKWNVFLWIAIGVGVLGLTSSYLRHIIIKLWFKLSWMLSLIIPNILLSIIYYLFLTPIAILYSFFGKNDPLMLSNKNSTTFKDIEKEYTAENFNNPW